MRFRSRRSGARRGFHPIGGSSRTRDLSALCSRPGGERRWRINLSSGHAQSAGIVGGGHSPRATWELARALRFWDRVSDCRLDRPVEPAGLGRSEIFIVSSGHGSGQLPRLGTRSEYPYASRDFSGGGISDLLRLDLGRLRSFARMDRSGSLALTPRPSHALQPIRLDGPGRAVMLCRDFATSPQNCSSVSNCGESLNVTIAGRETEGPLTHQALKLGGLLLAVAVAASMWLY